MSDIPGVEQLLKFKNIKNIKNMKKSDFFEKMHETLEISSVETLSEETIIRNLAEYNSLFLLTIVAFVDEYFNIQLNAEQLAGVIDIKSIMRLIGLEKFEE